MKYIIVSLRTGKALYGIACKTLNFSTKEIASEVATQYFDSSDDFLILEINI